jgi:transglutaminase-like putative cysteine protease/tetratricopeptide (TPR) repeat protein
MLILKHASFARFLPSGYRGSKVLPVFLPIDRKFREMAAFCFATLVFFNPQLVQAQTQAQAQSDQAGSPANQQLPQLRDANVDAKTFVRGAPVPSWVFNATPGKADTKSAFSIALADSQLHLTKDSEWYVRRIVQINDASALNQVGNLSIEFVPDYNKVLLHSISVIRAGQKTDRLANANVRYLQRERGLEQGMYSGVVTASILLNDVRVGDQIEYAYTIVGENPVYDGKYSTTTSWDVEAPVAVRRISMLFSKDRPLQYRWTGDASKFNLSPTVSQQGDKTQWVFEGKDIPVSVLEGYYPSGFLPYRFLQVSEFGSWNGVAQWADKLFAGAQATPKVKAIASQFANLATEEAKIQAALQYVQGQIRYFSVSLGESSHRPASPDTVIDRLYGDCKDKTQLLIAILRELKIDAKPALISVAYQRKIDQWFPTPMAFDHVIARVKTGGKVYYLDGTKLAQVGKLERMGQGLVRHQAFVVSANEGTFEEIGSIIGTELPSSEVHEYATVTAFDKPAALQVRQTFRGNAAEWMRSTLARGERSQIKQWLESEVTQRYSAAKLNADFDIKDDKELNEVQLNAAFTVPAMMQADKKSWFVRVSAPNAKGMLSLPTNRNRESPFGAISFPLNIVYSLQIQFPDNVAAAFDPNTQEFKNEYYAFTAQRTFRGSRAMVQLGFKTLTDTVPAQSFVKFVDDLDKSLRAMPSIVYVDASIIKDTGLFARNKTLQEQLTERYSNEVDLLSKAIASNSLNPNDLTDAMRERAGVLLLIGRFDEAIKDVDAVLKTRATDADALTTRANINSFTGKLPRAIDDYNRAIRLGAGQEAYYRRGIAHYYLGNVDAASDDFARSAKERTGLDGLYPRIWQAWTLRKLGKPIPDEFKALVSAVKSDQWPMSAMKLAMSASDPVTMLQSLKSLKGEERELALSEAYFYAGQEYLLRGDKAKAREMFDACVKIGAIHYIEHGAALLELEKLK